MYEDFEAVSITAHAIRVNGCQLIRYSSTPFKFILIVVIILIIMSVLDGRHFCTHVHM